MATTAAIERRGHRKGLSEQATLPSADADHHCHHRLASFPSALFLRSVPIPVRRQPSTRSDLHLPSTPISGHFLCHFPLHQSIPSPTGPTTNPNSNQQPFFNPDHLQSSPTDPTLAAELRRLHQPYTYPYHWNRHSNKEAGRHCLSSSLARLRSSSPGCPTGIFGSREASLSHVDATSLLRIRRRRRFASSRTLRWKASIKTTSIIDEELRFNFVLIALPSHITEASLLSPSLPSAILFICLWLICNLNS